MLLICFIIIIWIINSLVIINKIIKINKLINNLIVFIKLSIHNVILM